MVVKLFVLGRPGCGKSTSASYIEMQMRDREKEYHTYRICDYDILFEMSRSVAYEQMFLPTVEYEGFDVLDFDAFDIALKKLEEKVEEWIEKVLSLQPSKSGLVIIEFARDDYARALRQFKKEFLQDSYFLFLDVDVATCIQRIRRRTANPMTPDDHFVSEYIFDAYYHRDGKQFMTSELLEDYGVDGSRVKIIENGSSRGHLVQELDEFIDVLCSAIDNTLLLEEFSPAISEFPTDEIITAALPLLPVA